MTPDEAAALRPFATPRQAEVLDALLKHGTQRRAAKAVGLDRRNLQRALARMRSQAARKNPALHAHKAPEGYHLRGASTLVDSEGNVRLQWQKTARDKDGPEAVLEVFRAAIEDDPIPPAKKAKPVKGADPDRLAVYPMGDPHLGMYAWHEEAGADFNIEIAERNLVAAVDHLVGLAPPCKQALIVNLGDMLHSDTRQGSTTSGTPVDTDSRWFKIAQTAIRVLHRIVDRALEKHETVRLYNAIGNHDEHSSMMLSLALTERYRNEPRVTVDNTPRVFRYHTFGSSLIGITHGDKVKPARLPSIMAIDEAPAWGATKHRYWYLGHVHHQRVIEEGGCIMESFRTLAPQDAWHTSMGYRSGRSMICDVLHREHGRVLRHEVGIDALEGRR